jgi:hypothetical protein
MSFIGFHPLWDKILSQILQAVADQGRHLKKSSPYKGTAYWGDRLLGGVLYMQESVELVCLIEVVFQSHGELFSG